MLTEEFIDRLCADIMAWTEQAPYLGSFDDAPKKVRAGIALVVAERIEKTVEL